MHEAQARVQSASRGCRVKKLLLVTSLMLLNVVWCDKQPHQSYKPPSPAASNTRTYSNATYGFTFDYPTSMELVTPTYGNLKDEVVQVQIPKEAYTGTNFDDAAISVSAQSAKSLDDCLALTPPEGSDGFKTKAIIHGVDFYVTKSSDAGAGNFYESKVYRTVKSKGGTCIEISETIHTSNIDNYTPGTVTEVNQSDVQAKLDPIVQSFKFKL